MLTFPYQYLLDMYIRKALYYCQCVCQHAAVTFCPLESSQTLLISTNLPEIFLSFSNSLLRFFGLLDVKC